MMHFSTAITLSHQHLLQNDKFKEKSVILPVLHHKVNVPLRYITFKTKVITVYLQGNVKIGTKFHDNPSDRSQDILF